MNPKRVLIPTDFSKPSLVALRYASKMAGAAHTEFIVLFVVEPVVYATAGDVYGVADLGAILQDQQRAARAQSERLRRQWKARLPKLRTMTVTGSAAAAIVSAASKLKADLILMATHGRTGFSHLFLGSVAERVVRTAKCPVLTLRPPVTRGVAGRAAQRSGIKSRARRKG